MSEESSTSPDLSSVPPPTQTAEGLPRVRRISNPRIKRPTKNQPPAPAQENGDDSASAVQAPMKEAVTPEAATPSKFPEFLESTASAEVTEAADDVSSSSDWPEPEAPTSGTPGTSEHPKRKRRRKKGKGGNVQHAVPASESESDSIPFPESADVSVPQSAPAAQQNPAPPTAPRASSPPPHTPHAPRPRLDSELLAKFAWKIYLSEVSEEGVALIGDIDAKELSRRCFRLAEIFLEEQSRRR